MHTATNGYLQQFSSQPRREIVGKRWGLSHVNEIGRAIDRINDPRRLIREALFAARAAALLSEKVVRRERFLQYPDDRLGQRAQDTHGEVSHKKTRTSTLCRVTPLPSQQPHRPP